MAKIVASGLVDSSALANASNSAMTSYTSNLRVSDIVQSYGGNKNELARDIAGIPQGGKLPAKGTPERKAYDTASRNINRWLKSESGKEGQKRRPNAEAQGKLKGFFVKKSPPTKVVIDVTGDWVDPSGNVHRGKRIATDLGQGDPDIQGMLEALQNGDDMGAWHAALEGYVPGSYYESVSSISITFE